MNIELIKERVAEGYISVQKNPNADLFIYNYTPRAQFGRIWDYATLNCRGLILDDIGNVHARPFSKFFNYEELTPEQIPALPFDVYEKLDGSLGILYWIAGKPFIAIRGSFGSDQARIGTQILWEKYKHIFARLSPAKTYLFEIIYPENRIVIDYGETRDLFLLAIRDTETGAELPLEEIGFPIVKRFDGINDFAALKGREEANKEGFVICFSNGFRMKLKFAEYVRLHRLLTQVSSRIIWEYLSEDKSLDELLERVPDEFYAWVKTTKEKLLQSYDDVESYCKASFKDLGDRKTTALYFQTCKHSSVLFKMLDKQPYSHIIWKTIKPKYERPFKEEI